MSGRRAAATLLALGALVGGGCGGDDEEAERPATPATPGLPARVLDQLREGRSVLVFRHATTENASFEQEVLGDCAQQRGLSEPGREEARRIGRAIRAAEIPIGDVRASPMCRTRDTAKLMFGRVTVDRDLVTPGMVGEEADDMRRVRILRRLADTPPSGAGNTVLVTHTGNIGGAFDNESVLESGALLFKPDGDGRPSAPTRIDPDAWEVLAPG
jgi:phosphohistidine phosphatase SixA